MTLTWLFLFDPLSYGIYFLFQSLGILYDLDSNRKARDIDLFFIIQWRPPRNRFSLISNNNISFWSTVLSLRGN